MNSYLLHGENLPESRKMFLSLIREARAEGLEILRANKKEEKLDLNVLSRTQSMLGLAQLVVVENFFANNRTALQQIKELFGKLDGSVKFIFWESKSVSPQTAKALEKILRVQEYKIPKNLFTFLNSVTPRNSKTALKLLQNAKTQNPPDVLVIMLARQVRILYCLLTDPKGIKLPDWQKRNLEVQAKKFTPEQLLTLHHDLLELDRKNKKSQLPEDLGSSLDLLVASL